MSNDPRSSPSDSPRHIPVSQMPNDNERHLRMRDTIIMHSAALFDSLNIKNIPKPEFDELAKLISQHFGIKVGENKRTLVTGRIHPMLEKYGFRDHRTLLDALHRDPSGELLSELANRISTNHTSFFRENAHFQLLSRTVLPEIVQRKMAANNRDLRIWCAACATGEEAYTLQFSLLRHFGFSYKDWRAGLLATDISADALAVARSGIYHRQRLEAVPADYVKSYFDPYNADSVVVKEYIRREITFRRLNLISEVYPFKQPFDIIFCRNVMIYFSRAIRTRLITYLREWLAPGGYLFIGHSESLVGTHEGYGYVAPAVYRREELKG